MMKRFLALFLTLCLALTMAPALAETTEDGEEELGAATNPYTVEGLETVIALPSNVSVTKEDDQEGSVVLTLAMDGRTDVGFTISLVYNEAYVDYTMANLPDDVKQQLIDYYSENFKSDNAPLFDDTSDQEEFMQYFTPMFASGTGADGNLYVIYVCVCAGFVLTVSGGIAATEFDQDSYGTTFNLYWQAVDMFYQYLDSLGAFGE